MACTANFETGVSTLKEIVTVTDEFPELPKPTSVGGQTSG
jgi:hypothetical protein